MIDEAGSTPHDVVAFTARPTTQDIILNAMAMVRRSGVALLFGTFLTVLGVIGLVDGDLVGSLLTVVFGLSFLSGTMIVPFMYWSIHRRRDLVLAPIAVEADEAGIRISAAYGTSQHAWTVYRSARETSRAFLLDVGTGAASLLTKRDVALEDVEAFRALLSRVGLLAPTRGVRVALRPLVWVLVGLLLAGAFYAGPRFLADLGATVRLDLTTTVAGERSTVTGNTDLPNGARVGLQVLQLDEWERATGDGAQPDIDTWPWVDYREVTVQDGQVIDHVPDRRLAERTRLGDRLLLGRRDATGIGHRALRAVPVMG